MELKNQVCTYEQAKRLQELGIFESQFSLAFSQLNNKWTISHLSVEAWEILNQKNYPAFTVAELGVMLPSESFIIICDSFYNDHFGHWECIATTFNEEGDVKILRREEGNTEARSRAAMLIWLLENNHTTADEVNKKLKEA